MGDITDILENWSKQPSLEKNRVFDALYDQLKRLAGQQMHRAGRASDLQPTALVHEAYFKLVDLDRIDINGRCHFLGLAGRMMREVLVDEARRLSAQKRDRDLQTRLTGELLGDGIALDDLLQLHEALLELGEMDADYLWLVDARLFAGMTIEEAALGLGVSPATVKRKWRVARAWIADRMGAGNVGEGPAPSP
jgi:RNA polymerase sigma factor (TIGR02999 family)